ncbi:2-oxoglutarate-dependent dioxygenase mpl2 isoform X2 [Olea europaea var. sylvestris]|uniref:2-oxoglutarate-dependent dioxygenase mpl2 isoform X2 n=1 Tax=Olea europaea var. sylvestris TaxID=158386 RepID=UPI000C1D4E99|nr:2-oxoglutarate-dependent dioxygenase mpl2 isoform X2 [Olea europaea var. sylvestris]
MLNSIEVNEQELPASAKISTLNCIDLSNPDIQSSVSLLKQACLDSGFFYLINHGINEEFMDEVFAQSKRLFDLPMEEKMKLLKNEKHRGYTPVLDEHLDPVNQIHGDYKEGYYIGIEVSDDDPDANKPFYGPNVWPSSDILPAWRETMERYHQEALDVARAVARLIALALDLNGDFFDQPEMLGKPLAILRLLHYEGRTSEPAKGIFGAGAHSDFGLITLLATDSILGLQICKDKDAEPKVWEYVPPLKGVFIVNLGDMLERWSNGIFRSTLHRVLCRGQDRYSIVYFVEPNHDCIVECFPTCQSTENPPKFPPIKCESYMLQRYKDTHADRNTYK